jgi:riboflavin kinase/FMN adenylyltransferase
VSALGDHQRPSLVAIGNFDGVHLGHRAVLSAACSEARDAGLDLVVLTFDPHPAVVLGRPAQAVLTPVDRKVRLLHAIDPALRVVVEPFTKELAAMSPRAFVEDLLVSALRAKVVVVGQNFRFGQARSGDLSLLAALGKELGFVARAEKLEADERGPISSSRIRAAIAAGDVSLAEKLLGRPHALSGTVVRGDGRGRTIGVPTANLASVVEALPPHGVYACLVDRLDGNGAASKLSTGVLNIGNRPTVAAGFSVEVFLHDWDGDLYGASLRLHLVGRIRDEQKFSSLDALVSQIRADIETARLSTRGRTGTAPDGGWY